MVVFYQAFCDRFISSFCQGGAQFGEGAGVGEEGALGIGDEGNAVGAGSGGRKAVIDIGNAQVLKGGGFPFGQGDEGPGHNAVGEAAFQEKLKERLVYIERAVRRVGLERAAQLGEMLDEFVDALVTVTEENEM